MKRNGHKIAIATLAMVLSITVLMLATFAWYTLSTNPEIKGMNFNVSGEQAIQVSKDNKDYGLSMDLTDDLKNVKSLVPVSTYDGENWFVCKYDITGDVLQDQVKDKNGNIVDTQFTHLKFPKGSNTDTSQDASTANGAENPVAESADGEDTIFYVWKDIYLKTTEDEVNVYLTVPHADPANYAQDATENNHFGTYVMSYHTEGGENGQQQVTLLSGGSETCVRVGFKVLGEVTSTDDDGNDTLAAATGTDGSLFIYEPNADERSQLDKSSADYQTDKYIAGFEAKNFYKGDGAYKNADGKYLQTYPVKKRTNKDGSDAEFTLKDSKVLDGTPAVFPTDHLIVQKKSDWADLEDVQATQTDGKLTAQNFNSTMLKHIGKFVPYSTIKNTLYTVGSLQKKNADYSLKELSADTDSSVRSSAMLTTLEKDKPKKVRLYFWIEGQDVDCWNDVSSTDFLVNLEFSGQTN